MNLNFLSNLVGSEVQVEMDEHFFRGVVANPDSHTRDEVILNNVTLTLMDDNQIELPKPVRINFSEIKDFTVLKPHSTKTSDIRKKSPLIACNDNKPSSSSVPAKTSFNNNQTSPSPVPTMTSFNNNSKTSPSPPQPLRRSDKDSFVNTFNGIENRDSLSPAKANGDISHINGDNSTETLLKHRLYSPNEKSGDSRLPSTFVFVYYTEWFEEAIIALKKESTIGCGFHGINIGKYGVLGFIEMSTSKCVYVFDVLKLLCYETFLQEIKAILEDKSITKVMHDCRHAVRLMNFQYKIDIVNIYDIQVADVTIQKQKSGFFPQYTRNLNVLLQTYLNFTEAEASFFNECKRRLDKDNRFWVKRPANTRIVELAALKVRYLLELKRVTFSEMLATFTQGVEIYRQSTTNEDDEVQNEIDSALLPGEFSKLGPIKQNITNHTSSDESPKSLPKSHQEKLVNMSSNDFSFKSKPKSFRENRTPDPDNCNRDVARSQESLLSSYKNSHRDSSEQLSNNSQNNIDDGYKSTNSKRLVMYPTGMSGFGK